MAKQTKESRFASLRSLREQRLHEQENNSRILDSENKNDTPNKPASLSGPHSSEAQTTQPKPLESPTKKSESETSIPQKRGPGRPKGRRSNPDYTQISAYIPLDLLLAVQDELANERRENRQRTARPVSDLVEELLDGWLKKRKSS